MDNRIVPVNETGYKTGSLSGVTKAQLVAILGEPNIDDDESKVTASWGFEFNGVCGAVWDYYSSGQSNCWSTFGPDHIFETLFGKAYEKK